MTWIRFNVTLVLIVTASVAMAVAQGRMRHRWGESESVGEAANRLRQFPRDFGDWHMIAERDLDDDSRSQLECFSYLDRVYEQRKTGEKVTLLLILGPTGPTAVHTPEICVGRREYTPQGDRRELPVGQDGDRFWNKRFKSRNVHGETMSVSWAWNAAGKWIAAKDARYWFAGRPCLYKAQVACDVPDSDRNADGGQRFLTDFVPTAARYIVPDLKD